MQPWSLPSSARVAVLLLLSQGLLLGACGVTHRIEVADLSLPAPALTPLPLKMGLYFPPGLGTARTAQKVGNDTKDIYEFSIGPGTIAGFEAATAAMFDDVVPVQRLPRPAAESGAPAGTIGVSAVRPYLGDHAQVTYEIALYGADGEKRAAWSAAGVALLQEDLSACTRAAMRDAIASWMVGFPEQKDVRSWLESIGAVPPAAPPTPEEHS